MSDRAAAPAIFRSIAPQYSWMGAVLSLGQDGRWRREMVSRAAPPPGAVVLDVAAGTGLVSRALAAREGVRVVSSDASEAMVRAGLPASRRAADGRIRPLLARAEQLPFADGRFDAVAFTYLLRYVDDPAGVLRELARVLRPGGTLAALEFHVPDAPAARVGWRLYTRAVMPAIAAGVSPAWLRTARFLGPSIERLYDRLPLPEQVRLWQEAGIRHVRSHVLSLGAGVVVWGTKAEATDGR